VAAEGLSVREADYLIALLKCGGGESPVTVARLARELGVAKPTVTLMLKKLARQGLVRRVEGGYVLSCRGVECAGEIVWRHGVVEEALSRLGLDKDEACRVARLIELSIPLKSLQTIWRGMGCPTRCPHGLCILPGRSGGNTCRSVRGGRR